MAWETPYGHAKYELRGNVAWVTLDRPERLNGLTGQMHADLRAAWIHTNEDPDVRCIVLTAAGRAFCSGADMKEESSGQQAGQGGADRRTPSLDWIGHYGHKEYPGLSVYGIPDRMKGLPGKPLIVAVNGLCAGGGLLFVAEADFAICSEDATFFDPHVNVSVVPAPEMLATIRTRTLPRSVGLRISYQGKSYRINAERARELGMITEVVSKEQLYDRAMEIAQQVADAPPLVTRAVSAALWDTWSMPYDQARLWSRAYSTQVVESADAREGVLARAAGRKPEWTGR